MVMNFSAIGNRFTMVLALGMWMSFDKKILICFTWRYIPTTWKIYTRPIKINTIRTYAMWHKMQLMKKKRFLLKLFSAQKYVIKSRMRYLLKKLCCHCGWSQKSFVWIKSYRFWMLWQCSEVTKLLLLNWCWSAAIFANQRLRILYTTAQCMSYPF